MRGSVVALLALSACAFDVAESRPPLAPGPTSTALGTVTPVQPATENCREFTAPIKVGSEEKQAYGRACEQPDGSWQIVQPSPPPPTVIEHNVYRYYYDPWWGAWWGFGAFGFVGRHHHHHHCMRC
jgi:hypothetical protein